MATACNLRRRKKRATLLHAPKMAGGTPRFRLGNGSHCAQIEPVEGKVEATKAGMQNYGDIDAHTQTLAHTHIHMYIYIYIYVYINSNN